MPPISAEYYYDTIAVISDQEETTSKDRRVLEYFLLNDLRSDVRTLTELNEQGFFSRDYEEIIERLQNSYYDSAAPSSRLTWTPAARLLREAQIKVAERYKRLLQFLSLIMLGIISSKIYLEKFQKESFITLTEKSTREMQEDIKKKSWWYELLFAVLTGVLSTWVIYLIEGF